MGKMLIIKGADFSMNSLPEDPFNINVENYPLNAGNINNETGKWMVNSSYPNWFHIRIPIADLGGAQKITINTQIDLSSPRFGYNVVQTPVPPAEAVVIAFFSSALPNPVVDGSGIQNMIRLDSLPTDNIEPVLVPTNTEYIYLFIGYAETETSLKSYIPSELIASFLE